MHIYARRSFRSHGCCRVYNRVDCLWDFIFFIQLNENILKTIIIVSQILTNSGTFVILNLLKCFDILFRNEIKFILHECYYASISFLKYELFTIEFVYITYNRGRISIQNILDIRDR